MSPIPPFECFQVIDVSLGYIVRRAPTGLRAPVYHCSGYSGAEAVVHIHYGDAWNACIQHCEHGRETF
jgi:hypothetical protein